MWRERERDVFDNLGRGKKARDAQFERALQLSWRHARTIPVDLLSGFHSDQRGSISPTMLLATLPPAVALLLFISIACGQTGSTSGSPTPTPTEIAGTQTPVFSTPTIEIKPTSSPILEKKAEDSIPYYDVCTGGFSDPKTGRTGSILVTFIPASGMKQGGTSAVAFFSSSRNERNQIDEQQYVIYAKATGNNVKGNRGFWDADLTIDPITNQVVTGTIAGPPGTYNFQSLPCGANGKAAFTAALTSMRSNIDTTKVFEALEKFGVNWSKWPS